MFCFLMTAKSAARLTTHVPMNSTHTPSHLLATLDSKHKGLEADIFGELAPGWDQEGQFRPVGSG